jgi:hypothetical protein
MGKTILLLLCETLKKVKNHVLQLSFLNMP